MDKMFVVFVGIFFLVLTAFGIALVTDQVQRKVAATNPPNPDSAKSILISTPKDIPVGKEINISAVARAANSDPVPRAEICVNTTLGTVTPPCAESDEGGITSHVLTSSTSGIATITAVINSSVPINLSVSAEFTQ